MNWIRIATGIMRDPTLVHLSEALGVSVPTTTGHVVGVLTALPEGSKTGDLSQVSDSTLEMWAMWRGKRGSFAAAFRAHLCDSQGVVRSWEKHNGAAMRESEASAERAKVWREKRKTNAVRTENERRTNGVANGLRTPLRDETRRDVTTSADAEVVAREKPAPASQPRKVAYQQQLDELRAAGLPHEQAALDALIAGSVAPDLVVLELHATASGMHVIRGPHTGRSADVADVMRAVAEMAVSNKAFNVSLFRGFVRRVVDRPPEPPSAEEREQKKLAAKLAATPSVVIEPPRSHEEIEASRAKREAAMAMFRAEFGKFQQAEAA